nr:unnamed protein product [Digitaria exilis]
MVDWISIGKDFLQAGSHFRSHVHIFSLVCRHKKRPLGGQIVGRSPFSDHQWRPLRGQMLDGSPVGVRVHHQMVLHIVAAILVPVRCPFNGHQNAICSDLHVRLFILRIKDIQVTFRIDAQAPLSLTPTDGSFTTKLHPNASRFDDVVDVVTIHTYLGANPVPTVDASGTPRAPAAASRHARVEVKDERCWRR